MRLGGSFVLLSLAIFALPFGFLWLSKAVPAGAGDVDGKAIYMTRCVSCHQQNGQGIVGVFPPLDGTEWVQGDKGRLIRILLDGLTGETTVKGVVYSGAMPPWKTFLDDEQIAAVLTFIRSSWGNKASAVTAQEVALVRKATEARTRQWTEEELHQKENLGIPGKPAFPFTLGGARKDST